MKKVKTLLCRSLWMTVFVGIFSACSTEKENYLSSLPAESSMVFKMNVTQLVEKSNVLNNPLVSAALLQLDQQVPESLQEQYAEIKQNPQAIGIDLQQPLAIAVSAADVDNPQIVAVAAVSDVKKLNALLEKLTETDGSFTIEQAGNGVKQLIFPDNKELNCAYNDSRLVLTNRTDVVALTSQKAESSILADQNFKDLADCRKDLALFMDYDWIIELLKQQPLPEGTLTPSTLQLLEGCALFCEVNFETGKVVGSSQIYGNEELLKYQKEFYATPSGKFLGLLPADSYVAVNAATKNLNKAWELCSPIESQQIEEALQKVGLTPDIFNSIDGDIQLGVYNDESNVMGIPGIVLAIQCKDRTLFDSVTRMTGKAPAGNDSADKDIIEMMGYVVAFIDNSLVACPKALYDQCLAGGNIKPLKDNIQATPWGNTLKKGGIVIDFQSISRNKTLNQLTYQKNVAATLAVLKQLEAWTIQTDSPTKSIGELTLMDKNKNSLEQLITIGISAAMAVR
ncbi:MAG: DUF4836 family protein [Bacteroides sp.]|nr:DUF4836 family protein [Bacteroides sp.]